MAWSCPKCHREGTMANMAGGCYACDPPDFTLMELVPTEVEGKVFLCPRGEMGNLIHYLQGHPIINHNVTEHFDTGLCGNDAMGHETLPVVRALRMHFRAFLDTDESAKADYERHVAYLKQRAAEDQQK